MQVSEVAKLLNESKRPLIHVGQGARHAKEEVISFMEEKTIPFVTARNANDFVHWEHPYYAGRPGTFAQRGANFAVQSADFYLGLGTSLSLTQTGYNSLDYARNAKIVQVDIDQAVLDKGTLRNPIKICMDAAEFIKQLAPLIQPQPAWKAWNAQCQAWKAKYPVCLPEYKEQKYVNSYYFIDTLSEVAASTDVIVTDMGLAFQSTHQAWKVKSGQRLLTNCGLAPMGWGLPAAIGAAFATGRRVICITGDGGLMMNIQELATVAHHRLNIKIFVFNNGGYTTIKQTQQLGFEGRLMGVNKESGLSFPDFAKMADDYGFCVGSISDHTELPTIIQHALSCNDPTLVELMLDPDQPQAPRSLNRRNADGTMNPTKLEDSFPFLPPEVIAEEMSVCER